LFLGKNSSAYKSYDGQIQDALFKKQMQEQIANSPDGRIRMNRKSSASSEQFFQFPAQKRLFRQERLLMNFYLMEDTLPSIVWVIGSDTASFGDLHCQQAIAHFKGRDYTVWFCPDMPFHAGPWKLNGLPGVILDAYDSKKEVVFRFDGIEKVTVQAHQDSPAAADGSQPSNGLGIIAFGVDDANTDPGIIQLPKGDIKTTEKEFAKLQEAMRKDPNAFAQSMIASQGLNNPGNGPKMSINFKVGPPPVNNNPIELPETK
jgi:GLPGLI family protein